MRVYQLICEGACNSQELLETVAVLGQRCAENKNLYLGTRPCSTPEFEAAIRRLRYTPHTMTNSGDAQCCTCGSRRAYGLAPLVH